MANSPSSRVGMHQRFPPRFYARLPRAGHLPRLPPLQSPLAAVVQLVRALFQCVDYPDAGLHGVYALGYDEFLY